MDDQANQIPAQKTLWMYFREGLRRANAQRPVSFYLLLSIPVVLLLGLQIADMRDTPKRFAFFLGLIFIFFFIVLHRAIVDFIEITRRHFKESQEVFRTTLGDAEFITRLGQRVEQKREKQEFGGD